MEDYIDFPCSPTWLNWYHEIGLTPRRTPQRDRELVELYRRVAHLEEILLETLEEIKSLKLTMGAKTQYDVAVSEAFEALEKKEAEKKELEKKEEIERKFQEVYQKLQGGRR